MNFNTEIIFVYIFSLYRFLDTCVNRVKHHNPTKKPRPLAPTMFRDRGGSNRIPDRPRPRASLVETKSLHQSSGDHGLSMADNQFSTDECIYSVVHVNFLLCLNIDCLTFRCHY